MDEAAWAARHPRQAFGRMVRSAQAAQMVSSLDRRLSHYRRDRKFGAGSFRGMHVVVHRGYVVQDEVRVSLEKDPRSVSLQEKQALLQAYKWASR